MERQKFDSDWKKAFDQAEIGPSHEVWTNIELGLEKEKGNQLRKRLMFYQSLAAASVIFAIGVSIGMYNLKQQSTTSIQTLVAAKEQSASRPLASDSNLSTQNTLNGKTSTTPLAQSNASNKSNNKKVVTNSTTHDNSSGKNDDVIDDNLALGAQKESIFYNGDLSETGSTKPSLVLPQRIESFVIPKAEKEITADPVALMLARLEQREQEVRDIENKKENNSLEKLWTSVGFAAGSFSAINSGVTSPQPSSALAQNKPIADEEAKASGITYSVGVNVGTRVSSRWVVQGGVNYLTQSSDYTAQTAVAVRDHETFTSFRPQSINELDKISEENEAESIISTAPYSVNNNLRYLSIPIQAGYLLIDKTFGLQLNAGISTDVFLQNTLTAEGGSIDKTSQGIGEDSPYRPVNLSGLAGTELSYRFGKHYRVALNPGIRYPFNSIYRSELGVKATPLSFDVGLRFRYIFH